MTDTDRSSIEQACARLVARYANLNDIGAWEEVTSLFSPGGRMSRPSAPDVWIEGHAAILASFRARPARVSRHLCSNVVIDVDNAREARGECVVALFMPDQTPKIGAFHDRFALVGQEWKFAERRGSIYF